MTHGVASLREQAHAALAAGWTGDFGPTAKLLAEIDRATTPEASAWVAGLRAQWWHAEPKRGAIPAVADLEKLVGAKGSDPLALRLGVGAACAQVERAAILFFDPDGLEAWCALHERALAGIDAGAERLWLDAARAWQRLFAGDVEGAEQAAKTAAPAAQTARLAPLMIELASLRALTALLGGLVEEGTSQARRAARMAQADGLPQPQYLAHVVLARARRLGGRAHLATRILAALGRVAPRAWQGWIRWEMLLAEGARAGTTEVLAPADLPGAKLRDRAGRASGSLRLMILAAARGDRAGFASQANQAYDDVAGFPALAAEIDPVAIAVDAYGDLSRAPPALAAFLGGATTEAPPALLGLSAPIAGVPDAATLAWAVAWPDRPARRVLGIGVPLAGEVRDATEQRKRKPGRGETTIAALALAGAAGLAKEDLFAQVYGFAYAAHLHQGVLDVLLHRVRQHLGDTASLARDGERVVLTAHAPFVVPDPRCAGPLDDQVLRLLAKRGAGTAKDASEGLRIPLRTAQAALQQLVQQGACTIERQGRQIQYKVEDTTFSEPTRH